MTLNRILHQTRLFRQANKFSALQSSNKTSILPTSRNEIGFIQNRQNSSSDNTLKPFALLDDPPFILPSNPLSLMFSQFTRGFKIKVEMARVDPSFSTAGFHAGAQMAVSTVSNRIATGRFTELTDLVDSELIDKLKNRYGTLTSEEKDLIPIDKPNIASQRVIDYELLSSFQDKGPFVKLKLLFYMMNLQNIEMDDGSNLSMDEYFRQQVKNLMMAEYTFFRDYSPGSKSDWLITELNHYNSDYYGMSLRDRR